MKTFKEKAYAPQVEKMRKDLGKYQEKTDRKFLTNLGRPTKNQQLRNSLNIKPTSGKKKLSVFDYFLIGLIIGISVLFIFMIVTLFVFKNDNII